ncbi:MAG: hypothetical protein LQ337_004224 [Flavoplaca oasis]|nr:MAG: hypothetical protein LQ337_004224 [Flavoplaca oasis]
MENCTTLALLDCVGAEGHEWEFMGRSKEADVDARELPAPPTVNYTITTGGLPRQAKAVAESYVNPGVSMPANIRNVVERAVRAQTCMESSGSVPARQNHRGYVEPNTSISNRFSSLEMEERPDVDPVDVSEIATAVEIPTQTNASKTDPEIAAYEVNDEDEWDDE